MSISVDALISAKAQRLGTSASQPDFIQQCIDAINYVIGDIVADLDISVDEVTRSDGFIDLDSQLYRSIFSRGMDWYLNSDGVWTVENDLKVEQQYKRMLKRRAMNATLLSDDLTPGLGDLD